MAAPPNVTIKNLSGKFVMNKSLSDNPDALLTLQGLSWFTRKAIGLATVVLTIHQYSDKDNVVHIDITSVASGLSTTQENRELDWKDRSHKDKIFGSVIGRSRTINLATGKLEPQQPYHESDTAFLQARTLKDGKTPSKFEDESSLIQSYVKNQDGSYGWTAEQIWGFEDIKGKRYYTRRVVARNSKGDKTERIRLVYDYQGAGGKADEDDDGLAYGGEGEQGKGLDHSDVVPLLSEAEAEAGSGSETEREKRIYLTTTDDETYTDNEHYLKQRQGANDTKKIHDATRTLGTDVEGPRDFDTSAVADETGGRTSPRPYRPSDDPDDSGTVTDDYEADASEVEPTVVGFDRRMYRENTSGLSEISLVDTIICVGFGYALVYVSYVHRERELFLAPSVS